MKPCCVKEAKASIKRGRDVATCDTCGRLLLGYDNASDFQRTVDAITASGAEFEHARQGALWVIAKARKA